MVYRPSTFGLCSQLKLLFHVRNAMDRFVSITFCRIIIHLYHLHHQFHFWHYFMLNICIQISSSVISWFHSLNRWHLFVKIRREKKNADPIQNAHHVKLIYAEQCSDWTLLLNQPAMMSNELCCIKWEKSNGKTTTETIPFKISAFDVDLHLYDDDDVRRPVS